jgi:hypothetical protein
MTGGPLRPAHRFRPAAAIAAAMAVAAAMLLAPGPGRGSSETPAAAVEAAQQEPCLLPPAEMRRRHRDLLLDERRMAVRHGKRNPEASLSRCIGCHAVFAGGEPVPYDDERHFCRSCHAKVAVAPDCFSCHRSTPPAAEARGKP